MERRWGGGGGAGTEETPREAPTSSEPGRQAGCRPSSCLVLPPPTPGAASLLLRFWSPQPHLTLS